MVENALLTNSSNRIFLSTKNCKGFTKFKEGFGGKEIIYAKSYKFNYI